ncbi:MAG TPA: alternative ribosome rescue aminoacyl-tRNA hydrolase ArfB [Steroidobacteraceae bacterium]
MPLVISDTLSIPDELLEFKQVRASGPGGQNVNKVSNAVELRFDAGRWADLPQAARARLARLAGRRLSDAGVIVFDAQRFRSLEQNKTDALARLATMIRGAMVEPRLRRKTKPTRASKERRLAAKARDARVKRLRRRATRDD